MLLHFKLRRDLVVVHRLQTTLSLTPNLDRHFHLMLPHYVSKEKLSFFALFGAHKR